MNNNASPYASNKQGFTLVEMAIVMVVIGLVVGGVLTGIGLINSAERNSLLSQLNQYESAINQFKKKYKSLPGDMFDATAIWGVAHATPATCKTTQGTGTQTCDGDGDGMIEEGMESFRAWQQLANATLVSGSFTGIGDTGGENDATPNKNVPATSFKGGGYTLMYMSDTSRYTTAWYTTAAGVDLGNAIMVGRDNLLVNGTGSNRPTFWPLFTTKEAYSIDLKVDDGKPAFGKIRTNPTTVTTLSNYTPNCTTSSTAASSEYKVAQEGKLCSFAYRLNVE